MTAKQKQIVIAFLSLADDWVEHNIIRASEANCKMETLHWLRKLADNVDITPWIEGISHDT